jgi:arylsulfate sulfotransferase
MTFLLGKGLQALTRKTPIGAHPRRGPTRTRPHRILPRLEALEDRCLLSRGISLTPSEPAPQLVGEPITWTATVPDASPDLVYQFSVGSPGGPFQMVRDFSPSDQFTWAPMREGTYRIRVDVNNRFGASAVQPTVVTDRVDSRVTGDEPVITPTANPLVALYSVPPDRKGTVHVEFAVAGDNPSWQRTNDLPSEPGRSTNFFVAGMLPNTTYEMRDVFSDGTTSAPLLFTTGSLPSNLSFPTYIVQQPPGPGSDLDQGLIFQQFPSAPSNAPNPVATDLSGHVVWYFDVARAGLTHTYVGQSLVPGGTVLLLGVDQYAPLPATLDVLREIDLAGNTVRETNIDAVNAQLASLGDHPIFTFSHDVERLPNGDTAVIAPTERTIDVNGTPTEYVGMSIIVLDKNFQVSWVWDSFDHLDVSRGPILGEVLQPGGADQLTASTPVLPAVDWLHMNAVSWSPEDGNLVVSLRAQDWVLKIDYANGTGDGHVIWRLGQGGDFAVNSTDPDPWFSHQHDAHFIDDSTLVLFDNGNTRRASDPAADSRGQVWKLDEQTLTATLVLNVDMGSYSPMFGSAQRLSNGDYSFLSGGQGTGPKQSGQLIEVRPDGSRASVLADNKWVYRSFRMQTLYAGISDQLAGSGGETSRPGDDSEVGSRGDRQEGDGFAGGSLVVTGALSEDFGPAITAALNAPAGQPAIPAPLPVASPTAAPAAPPILVRDTDADPESSAPLLNATRAAGDAVFADPGNDAWRESLGDDLAWALRP